MFKSWLSVDVNRGNVAASCLYPWGLLNVVSLVSLNGCAGSLSCAKDEGQYSQVRYNLPLNLHRTSCGQEQGTNIACAGKQVLHRESHRQVSHLSFDAPAENKIVSWSRRTVLKTFASDHDVCFNSVSISSSSELLFARTVSATSPPPSTATNYESR